MKYLLILIILATVYCLPATIYAQTSHENAIQNINQGTLPENIARTTLPKERSFFKDTPLNRVGEFLGGIIALIKSQNIFNFAEKHETQSKTSAPETVLTPEGILEDKSVYGIDKPELGAENLEEWEKIYEQANFPDGIHPITGQ